MLQLATDSVNPKLKSIYFAIQNQLKVGNYRYLGNSSQDPDSYSSPISDEYRLVKKSVESLIVLWHDAHNNDRYKEYYNTVPVPNYFIFPSDYQSIVALLKDVDFNELLILISPVTTRESLSQKERQRLDDIESGRPERYSRGTIN